MKKTFTASLLIIVSLALSSAFVVKDSNGKAGYTGSPGENSCAQGGCHGGGSSAVSGTTISASPSFTNDEYIPGTVYTISLTAEASSFNKFGFACEVLNSGNGSVGILQSPGAGVKLATAFNSRKNVTHSGIKTVTGNVAVFTFQWVAPSAGVGDAYFYYCVNAVNGNGNTSGDLPILGSYTVTEGVPTNTTGIRENGNASDLGMTVYPNPAGNYFTLSYLVKKAGAIQIDLLDLNGRKVETLVSETNQAGRVQKTLNTDNIAKGVYFVKASSNGVKLGQKLLVIE